MRMQKKFKNFLAMLMAVVTVVGVVSPGHMVSAANLDAEEYAVEETKEVLKLYDKSERTDLEAKEVARAEDIIIAQGYGFCVEEDMDGISYDESATKVSYYPEKSHFDANKAGNYDTYYKVEPVSGKEAYLIHRTISVREPKAAVAEANHTTDKGSEDEEAEPEEESSEKMSLAEGEIADFEKGDTMTISMSSMSLMKAAATSKGDTMKVASNGYAKYCKHSIGIKYIAQEGAYKNHLVYCMDLNKNTTSGTVKAGSSSSSIKPVITFCLLNGARTLNGKCQNTKYSAGSAAADYFITSASIHVLNGEVKLSYYNDGSSVYNKIVSLVQDAKQCDKSKYDAQTGTTISIDYTISPKKTEWKAVDDGLYRSAEKFVRTKAGTITDVKYKITGVPSGLTVGELKTDASEIDNAADLKKYDVCIAQTDASKSSSNFYLYCNQKALKKIQQEEATVKVSAAAYSDERGGRKWTPSVVSQQKITFLEEYNVVSVTDSAKVITKYKTGSFSLKKIDKVTGKPVGGAIYYLYEDKACTDLLCKLTKSKEDGTALSGNQILTQSKYYVKEVSAPDGYQLDETVYEVGLEYFTLYDGNGKVIQKGKEFSVDETPEKVGVIVYKTDATSGNWVKGAGFAVFKDAACTVRVKTEGDKGEEVPVFYYDADLEMAASEKFAKEQETYYVKEVVVPNGYKDDQTVYPVQPENGSFSETTIQNTPLRCDVQAVKEDRETGKKAQGDATLEGATYGLYAAEDIYYPDGRGIVTYTEGDDINSTKGTDFFSTGEEARKGALLATVQTDKEGKFNFGHLYYGNYYIQEIEESEGYLLDTNCYSVDFTSVQDNHKDISLEQRVLEDVAKQPFQIMKVSVDTEDAESEVDYVKGAEFTVKLKSQVDQVGWDAAATYDVLVTDEDGIAVSKELPYGTYLVKETKVPKDLYKTEDFVVEITEDSREPQDWRVLNDAPFKAYIKLVKKDAENGDIIQLAGATFKIVNTKTGEYVSQKVGGKEISEFVTDETGTITTPLKLKYGEYEVEEIKSPYGYLLTEENIPFVVTKEGTVKVEEDKNGEPVIAVEISDKAVKGSIQISKTGEALEGISEDTIFDQMMRVVDGEDRNIDFVYEDHALAGTVFHVIAAENIYTPSNQLGEDGKRELSLINGVPATKGAIVATLTTDEKGEAQMDGLPLGKYLVQEVQAVTGYAICAKPIEVELAYEDDHTEVVYGNAEFENERVKTELSVIKTDGVTERPVEGATYGVYAGQDFANVYGDVKVVSGSLIGTAVTNASGTAVFTNDLPLGSYYVKEIESPEGYVLDENAYDVDFVYEDQDTVLLEQQVVVKETPIIVEVSKKDITTGKELKGATLEVLDAEGEVYASWVTDGTPYQLEAIPAGEYTLRETASPYGYLIANEVSFTVEETGEIQKVEMSDERVKGMIEILKTDSVSKKAIKGVTFELRDEDGKTLATLVTDKKGYAKTDLLDICTYDESGNYKEDITYYVVETKAAEGYILDEKPHKVQIKYDGSAKENVVYTLQLENKPENEKLPQTGGNYHPWMFLLAGGALIGAGIYLYRRKQKMNKQ